MYIVEVGEDIWWLFDMQIGLLHMLTDQFDRGLGAYKLTLFSTIQCFVHVLRLLLQNDCLSSKAVQVLITT